jgi:hypothetical protein
MSRQVPVDPTVTSTTVILIKLRLYEEYLTISLTSSP